MVNPAIVDQKQYATMVELLEQRGYIPKEHTKYSFVKRVQTTTGEEHIQVDFLGPEYGGTAKKPGQTHLIFEVACRAGLQDESC